MRLTRLFLVTFAGLYALFAAAQTTENSVKSQTAKLDYFNGQWTCSGKFVSSGKEISADLKVEPGIAGRWLILRHDDRPPFHYHALSEWTWDEKAGQYVSLIQDSFGGMRVFHSTGWRGSKLLWESGSGDSEGQRFEYNRVSDVQFKVSYSTLKGTDWNLVDESACTKQL